ncbi:MAG: zinc-dependent peptidase [Taibaiella sp.]|nr:zinc-dependent peptidase [Taibaiella sp.]
MLAIIILIVIIAVIITNRIRRNNKIRSYTLPAGTKKILSEYVAFYRMLGEDDKLEFEDRIRDFLARTAITGIDIRISDTDRILVAASAIIPIFSFPGWRYNNISEVLLYQGAFDKNYQVKGARRNILGMVGNGAMQGQMILSQPSLVQGFANAEDGRNTAIHEFAHLIDKADGAVDGVPEYLLAQPNIKPWITHMHDTIEKMKRKDYSDIDPYGATSEAEFFAVVSEYFFERPDKLQSNHPELYTLMEKMFQRKGKL